MNLNNKLITFYIEFNNVFCIVGFCTDWQIVVLPICQPNESIGTIIKRQEFCNKFWEGMQY